MSERLIGIDLGTTFCAVATIDERGKPVMVPNNDNEILTPSAVLMIDESRAVVGQPAIDAAFAQPENVATLIKRYMGREAYDRPIAGRTFRPETLSAIILRKLLNDATQRLGPIKGAVITVPAYFDDTRRKATKDAGRIAGLNVIDILDEPTAAALAYCFDAPPGSLVGQTAAGVGPEKPQIVLVYDLGGGTFDVSLVRLSRNTFRTLAIEGDVRLGGKDWDAQIVDHAAKLFLQKFGSDPRDDPQSLVALQEAAERAKRSLSRLPTTNIVVNHAGQRLSVPLSREEFEKLTSFLLLRTKSTTQSVLKQANVTWDQIDRVLLVGGSTHMPMTAQMIRQISGKEPDGSLAVSEVVARGAALHAGIAMARRQPQSAVNLADVVEINVNAHSLGVEIRHDGQRINDKLILKNTQLPVSASRVYRTVTDGQTMVRVKVLQGEATQAEACIPIGECWIEGLPPNLPKGSPVQVQCGYATDGLIEIQATDMTSGKSARASIRRTSGLSEAQIAEQAGWLKSLTIS